MRVLLGLLLSAWAAPAWAVDGVIEINEARVLAGGITVADGPGYPATIGSPGSYRLTGELSVSGANETVVAITTSDVTLDLNGFTIRCLFLFTPCAGNGSGNGIRASAGTSNVTIRNGTVRDMGASGLFLEERARVENVTAIANGDFGIKVGFDGIVAGSIVAENLGAGIFAAPGSRVEANVVVGNRSGVGAGGAGVLIVGNTIRLNSTLAIGGLPASPGAYAGNNITANNMTSDTVDGNQGIIGVQIGTNLCGTNTSCP